MKLILIWFHINDISKALFHHRHNSWKLSQPSELLSDVFINDDNVQNIESKTFFDPKNEIQVKKVWDAVKGSFVRRRLYSLRSKS